MKHTGTITLKNNSSYDLERGRNWRVVRGSTDHNLEGAGLHLPSKGAVQDAELVRNVDRERQFLCFTRQQRHSERVWHLQGRGADYKGAVEVANVVQALGGVACAAREPDKAARQQPAFFQDALSENEIWRF